MNFLKRKTTWTNAELIPLKLAIASIYLIIGAFFPDIIKQLIFPVIILFIITVIWSVYLWIKKLNIKH